MENKEYLNEEWYQNVKKKITRISLIILIIALLIGGGLIATGIIKTNSSKKETEKLNEERYNAAYKEAEEKAAANQARLSEITAEIETLKQQSEAKSQECDSLKMGESDWFARVSQCRREESDIQSNISDLEMEKFKLDKTDYMNIIYYNKAFAKDYTFLCVIGGIVIFAGGMIALSVYITAKKREIRAFTIQQSMPVTQEAINKMAPTVGNAAGTIGKEIAKGITSGIKEGTNDNKDS